MPDAGLSNWSPLLILAAAVALAALAFLVRRRVLSRRELERRSSELDALVDFGRSIAQSRLAVGALCELIHRTASKMLDTSSFQIGLFEDDQYAIRLWIREGERLPPAKFDLAQNGGLIG